MSNYAELKTQLSSLKERRRQFLHTKSSLINNIMLSKKDKEKDSGEHLHEIDQQLEELESVISTSVKIAMSIITPVQERERIITNIGKTIDVLSIEREIKDLLEKLEEESIIEAKIQIILKANKLIKKHQGILESYHELFMQKSLDVLSYLNTNYNTLQVKVSGNGPVGKDPKEINDFLNEMDKTSVLNYKLSNNTEQLFKFFTFLAEYINNITCSTETIQKFGDSLNKLKQMPTREQLGLLLTDITKTLQSIFKKITLTIKENQSTYLQIEGEPIHLFFIQHLIKRNVNNLIALLSMVIEITSLPISDISDLLCGGCSHVLLSCELFKFEIITLCEKLHKLFNLPNKSIDSITLFQQFNTVLYDIGEKYCNNEITHMKNKITSFFVDESKKYSAILKPHLNNPYAVLFKEIIVKIDDEIFMVLQLSGERAIKSLNVQIALAIINHIKEILSEDLFHLLDMKISAILVKTENSKLRNDNIKYSCRNNPSLSNKNQDGNLFLISCLNCIDQAKEDIPVLMEGLKEQLAKIQMNVFDHRKIKLGQSKEKEDELNSNMAYFKPNELEIIKMAFDDIDSITKKYDDFLNRKMILSFQFLEGNITSLIDMLNSVNYLIDQSNIATVEMSESFSAKFIEETDNILRQWKSQMADNVFGIFIEVYTNYVVQYMETVLTRKMYSSFGVVLLEKDINKIANYLQTNAMVPIREKFNRLFSVIKVLNFDSKEELKEYMEGGYGDISLKESEIDNIRQLKKD